MSNVSAKDEIMLEGIIDYAGLLSPSNLDMHSVVKNWASCLQSENGWMLGRLIIPVSRLDEFKEQANDLFPSPEEEMWQLSVLLPPANDEGFKEAVQKTIDFNMSDCGAVANVVEFKADTTLEIESALDVLHDDLFPFVELPMDKDPRGLIALLSSAIAGAKFYIDGEPSLMFAFCLHNCATSYLPFKTGGEIGSNFLNILQAATAVMVDEVSVEVIEEILDSPTQDFSSYTELQLEQARGELFNSFSSTAIN
jgi:hypothetical protein